VRIIAKRILGDKPDIELSDEYIVEFGESHKRIHVAAVRDGVVEVRSPNGTPIRVEPRAANVVWVSTKSWGTGP
jgi:hypothetical protein